MKRILFVAATFILTGTLLTGCSNKSEYTAPPTTKVLFANLSARNPSLDFYAGVSTYPTVATAVAYQGSTGYMTATTGVYGVIADTAGQNDNNTVIAQWVQLGGGNGNSMYIIDSSLTTTRAVVTTDIFSAPGADSAGVRCFNFAPDAPKLDIYIKNTTTPDFTRDFLYRQTNEVNVASLTFRNFLKGDYTISIRQAGTTTELYSLQVTLASTKLYTLYTSGFINKPGTAQAFKAGLVAQVDKL